MRRPALGFDRDHSGDARYALAQDALHTLSKGDRRHRTAIAGPEPLHGDGVVCDALQLDVTAVHLDGRTDQLERFSNLILDGDRYLIHRVILPAIAVLT